MLDLGHTVTVFSVAPLHPICVIFNEYYHPLHCCWAPCVLADIVIILMLHKALPAQTQRNTPEMFFFIINTYIYETPLNHAGHQVVLQKFCNISVCIQYVISQSMQGDGTFLRLDIRVNTVLHANGANCTNLIDTRRGDSQSHWENNTFAVACSSSHSSAVLKRNLCSMQFQSSAIFTTVKMKKSCHEHVKLDRFINNAEFPKHLSNSIPMHTRTQSIGQLEEVRFERWFERCECVWWPNFVRATVPDRWCSIRKRSLTKWVHAHTGKSKNGSIGRRV